MGNDMRYQHVGIRPRRAKLRSRFLYFRVQLLCSNRTRGGLEAVLVYLGWSHRSVSDFPQPLDNLTSVWAPNRYQSCSLTVMGWRVQDCGILFTPLVQRQVNGTALFVHQYPCFCLCPEARPSRTIAPSPAFHATVAFKPVYAPSRW